MPAIVKLVVIVLCIFVVLPLGTLAVAALCFPRTPLGARLVRARGEILTTAVAISGVEILAGSVSRSYAIIVGLTCLLVIAGMLISDTLKHYRWHTGATSRSPVVASRPARRGER
jgi:hypothetical protein